MGQVVCVACVIVTLLVRPESMVFLACGRHGVLGCGRHGVLACGRHGVMVGGRPGVLACERHGVLAEFGPWREAKRG